MKRCPECDFIYENDQRFCDMDGRELPFSPGPLLTTGGMVARPPVRLVQTQRRKLAVRVAAALILGAVLFLAFYGFMHRGPAENITYPSATAIASKPSAPNAVLGKRPAELTEEVSLSTTPPSRKPASDVRTDQVSSARTITPRYRTPIRRRPEVKSESNQGNHKKESKVGSFLKKTGRLLKKPFGF